MLLDRVDGDPVWALVARAGWLATETSFPKAMWSPRRHDRWGAPFAGTCVRHRDQLYEVREATQAEAGSYLYVLAPWEPGHQIRRAAAFDTATHRRERAEHASQRRDARLYPLLYLAYPLLGALPARWQNALGERFGLQAATMTWVSALGAFWLFTLMAARHAASLDLGPLMLVALLGIVESVARFRHALILQEPMGSFPPWLAALFIETTQGDLHRARRRREGRFDAQTARRRAELAAQLDLRVPRPDGGLTVKSFVPKSWSEGVAVGHGGRFYCVESVSEEASEEGRLHVYALRPADVSDVLRGVVDYRPDDALLDLRRAETQRRADRLNVRGAILGLLPAADQEELEFDGYDALMGVRHSAVMACACALTYVVFRKAHPTGGPADVLGLLAAAALAAESLWRFVRTLRGEIRGSVLGLPLSWLRRARRPRS